MVSQLTNSIGNRTRHSDAKPRIISKTEHGIDRSRISSNAIEVVERLQEAGFTSELVGGCVRDLLLGNQPKDFDVSTNARPGQVRPLFRYCEIFGRRFQIAQVRVNGESIQVATYRKAPVHNSRSRRSRYISAEGKILKDNKFGDIRQDAFRRDLTINALYLQPSDMRISDYTGGFADAMDGVVRVIGNPARRYREDPVRMLRAVRFATLPGFMFDEASEQPIAKHARLLAGVSNFRLVDELSKMLFNGFALSNFELLYRHDVFRYLFPPYQWLHSGVHDNHGVTDWLRLAFGATDERVQRDEHTSVAFTFAALLWPKFKDAIEKRSKKSRPAIRRISRGILKQQIERTFLADNVARRVEQIWHLQHPLERGAGHNDAPVISNSNFRPALRLMELRASYGEVDENICNRWIEIREAQQIQNRPVKRHRRRRSRWK